MSRSSHRAAGVTPAPFADILCAVNGSRDSRLAVAHALTLAGPDAEVHFVAVCDVHGKGANRAASVGRSRAEDALRVARLLARRARVTATTELLEDSNPRKRVLAVARGHDLLVLGTHGHSRTEGIVIGGMAALALHAAEVPVLVAREAPGGRRLADRVLVASDGSPPMRNAAEVAGAIAARGDGDAMLLHVTERDPREVRRELAQEATDLFLATGVEPVVRTLPGRPADTIVAAAADYSASLLVLGSRALSGVRALGSVSERVGAAARCSVLVMRPAVS